jgi:uncharacterized membrane protein YidH (DUF202 family)
MDEAIKGILLGMFLLAAGAFTFGGAVWRWGFYVCSRRTRNLEDLIGVKATQWFHIMLGIGLMCLGVVVLVVVAVKR